MTEAFGQLWRNVAGRRCKDRHGRACPGHLLRDRCSWRWPGQARPCASVKPRGQRGESPCGRVSNSVVDGNCVSQAQARRGGEQPETNRQSVEPAPAKAGDDEPVSAGACGEPAHGWRSLEATVGAETTAKRPADSSRGWGWNVGRARRCKRRDLGVGVSLPGVRAFIVPQPRRTARRPGKPVGGKGGRKLDA